MLELKLNAKVLSEIEGYPFNRTMLELKYKYLY